MSRDLPPGLGAEMTVACGKCNQDFVVRRENLIKRSVTLAALKDVLEVGCKCPTCGTAWRLGFIDGYLLGKQEAIVFAKTDEERQRLQGEYIRHFRWLMWELGRRGFR
jgi:hypothetical protein